MMSKINNWINSRVFSMEFVLKIALWIANATLQSVSTRAGLKNIPTVFVNLVDNFDEVQTSSLQKGASLSWIAGLTSYDLTQQGRILILLSYDALRRDAFINNPLLAAMQILGLVGHEAFHACQLEWLLENKGAIMFSELVNKVWQYNTSVDYHQNVLEVGAEEWGKWGRVQDFTELAQIIR